MLYKNTWWKKGYIYIYDWPTKGPWLIWTPFSWGDKYFNLRHGHINYGQVPGIICHYRTLDYSGNTTTSHSEIK